MLEKRLVDLEIKFSHQDDLVNELNLIVAKQQIKIEMLQKQVINLLEAQQSSGSGNQNVEDKPPHY